MFKKHPIEFVKDDHRSVAVKFLREYSASYTGSAFDEITRGSDPDRITGEDIAALTTLSVNVPGGTTKWLLAGPGGDLVAELLEQIPLDQAIWDDDADLTPNGPAWKAWDLIDAQYDMGPTKTSKLLAAKRPHLIPIYDQYVGGALLGAKRDSDWAEYRDYLRSPEGTTFRAAIEGVRDEAGLSPELSVLRVFDIVVWMSAHGADAAA